MNGRIDARLILAVVGVLLAAVVGGARSAHALEVRPFTASAPEACPVAEGYQADYYGNLWRDIAIERPDARAMAALTGWLQDWSEHVLDLSAIPADHQHVCVGMYDEGPQRTFNAYAVPGMNIFYGARRYATFAIERNGGERGWSAQALLGHEFGHLLQGAHGRSFGNRFAVRDKELQSDCVAGFLMESTLVKQGFAPERIRSSLGQEFADMGDTHDNFLDRHHGRPDQRRAALVKGADLADVAIVLGQLPKPSAALLDSCAAELGLGAE